MISITYKMGSVSSNVKLTINLILLNKCVKANRHLLKTVFMIMDSAFAVTANFNIPISRIHVF